MIGHKYQCDACRFQFFSGWSHHVSGQACVCRGCGEVFRIASVASPLGAMPGEQLPLLQSKKSGKRGVNVRWEDTGRRIPVEQVEGRPGITRLMLNDARCFTCEDQLLLSFSPGEACPACHQGHMVETGEVIY